MNRHAIRAAAVVLAVAAGPAFAQTPVWAPADLLAAAKAEGALTVYSSVNEQEALPTWKVFEDATGVKVLGVAFPAQMTDSNPKEPGYEVVPKNRVQPAA